MIAPLDPYSEVVDANRRWRPDWYSWLQDLSTQFGQGSGSNAHKFVYLSDFITTSGDQTANINAAFATLAGQGGTLVWDVTGHIATSGPIIVGVLDGSNNTGPTSFINIQCPVGPDQGGINYSGPTNGVALIFAKNKYFSVSGLGINNIVSRGTTTGIMLGGQGGSGGTGTQTLAFTFNDCTVSGFDTGISAGGNFGDASEGLFNNQHIYNCNTGFIPIGFNSLDFNFNLLSMSNCDIGVNTGAAENFHIWGGSSTLNQLDFRIDSNSLNTTIVGWRTEGPTRVMHGVGGQATMISCRFADLPSPFIAVDGLYSQLTLIGNNSQGSIQLSGAPQIVTMIGNRIERIDSTNNLPLTITAGNAQTPTHALLLNNTQGDTGVSVPDFCGILKPGYGGSFIIYEPIISKISQPNNVNLSNVPQSYGVDYLALSHVRQLSESSIPGAIGTPVGTANAGKNLRVSAKFAGASTVSVLFARTINVSNTSQSTTLQSVGLFLPTDAGKPVKIAGKGNNSQTDWYGYVLSYTDASHIELQPSSPQDNPFINATVPGVIGENEPDANYVVAGLCGDVNETFWVTGITATGFTLHSSNATSTATVNCLIVR